MKKITSFIVTLCMILTMSITVVSAETTYGLTIVDNTVSPAKTYELTAAQLDQLATTKNHSFSGINNQGSVKIEKNIYGINLKKLLKEAGFDTDKKIEKIKSIEFDASGDTTIINTSTLFATRYYFSKLEEFSAVKGKVKTDKSKKNRTKVTPIIALGSADDDGAKLYFGQKYASERNWPKFWSNITTITLNKTAAEKEQWGAPALGIAKEVKVGTAIAFKSTKGFIYYTMNGKEPNQKNAYIYNYAPKLNEDGINAKKFTKTGKYTVKAVVKGFGKTDSKVKTFTIKVLSAKKYNEKHPIVVE